MPDLFGEPAPGDEPPERPNELNIEMGDEAQALLGGRERSFRDAVAQLAGLFDNLNVRLGPLDPDDRYLTARSRPRREGQPLKIVVAIEAKISAGMLRVQERRARERLTLERRAILLIEAAKSMRRVCPMPDPWHRLYSLIVAGSGQNELPRPFILGGWHAFSAAEKAARFEEHLHAASANQMLMLDVETYLDRLAPDEWLVDQTEIPDDLIAAYGLALYTVGQEHERWVLRINQHSDRLHRLMRSEGVDGAAFITAFNPWSQPTTDVENNSAHERLRETLVARGNPVIEGSGGDAEGVWPQEKSFLALGVSFHEARELGNLFRQNAVVWAGPDAVPRLLLLR